MRKANSLSFARRGGQAPPCEWNLVADSCLKIGQPDEAYYPFTRPSPLAIVPTYWGAQSSYPAILEIRAGRRTIEMDPPFRA